MNHKLSKLVICLAAVCAFSGQAVAAPAKVITITQGTNISGYETFTGSFKDTLGSGSFSTPYTFTLASSDFLTGVTSGTLSLATSAAAKSFSSFGFTLSKQDAVSNSWLPVTTVTAVKSGSNLVADLNNLTLSKGTYELTLNGTSKIGGAAISGNFNLLSPIPAVPEPTEGALLLSGVGLLGFIAARRKNVA